MFEFSIRLYDGTYLRKSVFLKIMVPGRVAPKSEVRFDTRSNNIMSLLFPLIQKGQLSLACESM